MEVWERAMARRRLPVDVAVGETDLLVDRVPHVELQRGEDVAGGGKQLAVHRRHHPLQRTHSATWENVTALLDSDNTILGKILDFFLTQVILACGVGHTRKLYTKRAHFSVVLHR